MTYGRLDYGSGLQGEPVMGRAWNENGKIAANFAWNKREFKGNVGSIQLLLQVYGIPRGTRVYRILCSSPSTFAVTTTRGCHTRRPPSSARTPRRSRTFSSAHWVPPRSTVSSRSRSVYVDNGKLFISPCVVVHDGKEVLGKVSTRGVR